MTAQRLSRTASRQVFILRLWRETRGAPTWLGQVQHIRTGQVVYVRGPKELLDYLQGQMDQPDAVPKKKIGLK